METSVPESTNTSKRSDLSSESNQILARLRKDGDQFDFFQAVWILERILGRKSGDRSEPSNPGIRIRPHSAQVFPPSDVKSVETTDGGARMTVTFMGLYGIGSPMPDGFDGGIAKDTEQSQGLRDFLDIFNNRFYWYFYRAWQRHHLGHEVEALPRRTAAFLGLSGLATAGSGGVGPGRMSPTRAAAFSGQLGGVVRNAQGLASFVAEMLGLPEVQVLENVPRRVPMPNRPVMGASAASPMRLGKTSTIGATVFDVSGKFRIVIGPVSLAQYSQLLPGHPDAHRLASIVELFAPDNLDYDVELLLDVGEVPALSLGNTSSRLGRNTWLGRPEAQVVREVVRYN